MTKEETIKALDTLFRVYERATFQGEDEVRVLVLDKFKEVLKSL